MKKIVTNSLQYKIVLWTNSSHGSKEYWVLDAEILLCILLLQSCSILYDHMDCSPPGSSVNGIL